MKEIPITLLARTLTIKRLLNAGMAVASGLPVPRGENLAQMVFYRFENVLKDEFGCNPLPWQKHRALWAGINIVLADCRAEPPPEYASWWEREERTWYEAALEREARS